MPRTKASLFASISSRARSGVFARPHQAPLWATNSWSIRICGSTVSRSDWGEFITLARSSLWTMSAHISRWPPSQARRIQS